MELKFKGLPELLKRFPDDATARHYFEAQRWQGCPVCPFCGSMQYYAHERPRAGIVLRAVRILAARQ